MNWLRWYVGTCTDAKLHKASRLAHVRRSVVIAAWAALLEEARRNGDDGAIGDVDPSWLASQIDEKPSTCGRVIDGMRAVALIDDSSVIAFATRQFSSDFSRGRTSKWRERHRVKSLTQNDTGPAGDDHVTEGVTYIDQNRTEQNRITPTPTVYPPFAVNGSGPPSVVKPPAASRGTRLDPDWTPGAEGSAYAMEVLGSAEVVNETWESFRDYWLARAGAGARKTDWPLTWKTWVRKTRDELRDKAARLERRTAARS